MILPVQFGAIELELAKALILGLLAAASVVAVSRAAAVYHDGLRTNVPELWTGGRGRRELSNYAYAISIGFIVAYALPYSLATGIIIIHIVLLSADIIGLRVGSPILATVSGFAYGFGVTIAVDIVVALVQEATRYGPGLAQLLMPVAYTFPILAAVAAAQQWGLRIGALVAAITVAGWVVSDLVRSGGSLADGLTATGGAVGLAVGTAVIVGYALRSRAPESVDPSMFDEGIARIQRVWPYLVVPPALLGVAAAQGWVAGEPLQLALLAAGVPEAAAIVALFSAVAFLPMVGMSGLMSGVWNQDGYPDWYLAIGYLARNPLIGGVAGLALVAVEVLLLRRTARLLTSFPELHSIGSAARDALDTVPTFSILAGAVIASIGLAGPLGAVAVIGAWTFNEAKGRPVMPIAVPVFAFLAVVVATDVAVSLGVG